ncbi:hypothetical protein Barb7_00990 [Bacteroidales bacterium Barb7]|nr:hypothetical protein Barb7_00990 [Bacteroidales bacterium Barb7]
MNVRMRKDGGSEPVKDKDPIKGITNEEEALGVILRIESEIQRCEEHCKFKNKQ